MTEAETAQLSAMIEQIDKQRPDLSLIHILRGTVSGEINDETGDTYDNPQALDETGKPDIWDNVSRHCLMGTHITDILAEAMGVSVEDRMMINQAFWLHDSGKKTERNWQRILAATLTDLTPEIDAQQIMLHDLSLMEEWENAEAGFPIQVSKLMKANIPPSIEGHDNLLEKIVWFADACLTETVIQEINQRFDNLEQDPKRGQLNREFSQSFTPKYGMPLYDVQRSLGLRYEQEFCELLSSGDVEVINSHTTIYDWLKEKTQERLNLNQLPLL